MYYVLVPPRLVRPYHKHGTVVSRNVPRKNTPLTVTQNQYNCT